MNLCLLVFNSIFRRIELNIGQYKTWTPDYGLRTGYEIRTRYKTRTGKYGLGIKQELGIKRGLRTVDCGLGINVDYGLLG